MMQWILAVIAAFMACPVVAEDGDGMKEMRRSYLVAPRGKFNPNDLYNKSIGLAGKWEDDFRIVGVPGDVRRFAIAPRDTGSGAADTGSETAGLMRFTFVDPETGGHFIPVVRDEPYYIDLDDTGLGDGSTSDPGGRIDGLALAASTDYLIWAFLNDAGDELEGIGVTTRPRVTGVTMPVSAGLGVSNTVDVGTPNSTRFSIGARVLFRNGTTAGSSWNQAVITANNISPPDDFIGVTLDALWSSGLTNPNTDMSSVGSVEVIQLDMFEPRIGGESDTYDSGRRFSYLGSIHTDASSNIRYWRKRGNLYLLPGGAVQPLNRAAITATESFQVCLGNWLPRDTTQARLLPFITPLSVSANGRAQVHFGDAISAQSLYGIGYATLAQLFAPSTDVNLRQRDSSLLHTYTETGTNTITHGHFMAGYYEDQW